MDGFSSVFVVVGLFLSDGVVCVFCVIVCLGFSKGFLRPVSAFLRLRMLLGVASALLVSGSSVVLLSVLCLGVGSSGGLR